VKILALEIDAAHGRGLVAHIEDFDSNTGNFQGIRHRLDNQGTVEWFSRNSETDFGQKRLAN
jgi:hypothetical protein